MKEILHKLFKSAEDIDKFLYFLRGCEFQSQDPKLADIIKSVDTHIISLEEFGKALESGTIKLSSVEDDNRRKFNNEVESFNKFPDKNEEKPRVKSSFMDKLFKD